MKNKKGADKVLSVYWFVILFLVASGIFGMVYIFYKSPFDVREMEGQLMTNRIAECVSPQGKLNPEFSENFASTNGLKDAINYASKNEINNKICNCGLECESYGNYIENAADKNGVSDLLLLSIMMQESLCKKDKCSSTDLEKASCGLMQINLKHCGKFGLPADRAECKNVLITDTEKNVEIGAKILKENYDADNGGKIFSDACTPEYQKKTYYGGDAALRGYNGWGCGKDKDGNEITDQDFYVDYVNGIYGELKKMFGNQNDGGEKTKITEECGLNFKSEFDKEQYYLQIDFYDLKNFRTEIKDGKEIISSNPTKTIFDGNENLKTDCEIQNVKISEKQSKCFEERFYSVDENNNHLIIKILSLVRKTEKNAI